MLRSSKPGLRNCSSRLSWEVPFGSLCKELLPICKGQSLAKVTLCWDPKAMAKEEHSVESPQEVSCSSSSWELPFFTCILQGQWQLMQGKRSCSSESPLSMPLSPSLLPCCNSSEEETECLIPLPLSLPRLPDPRELQATSVSLSLGHCVPIPLYLICG